MENDILKIIKESKNGLILQNGIKTVIVGKPNVGKSSLLNNLLEEDKAIVTDIAGTTQRYCRRYNKYRWYPFEYN